MSKLFIINDLHLGVTRSAGTTRESAAALSQWMLDQFQRLLDLAEGCDLLINGDLFDKCEVSREVEFQVFKMLGDWMDNTCGCLILSAGNHDENLADHLPSSFRNLCKYMEAFRPYRVDAVVGHMLYVFHHSVVVPHMPNQTLFDKELEKVLNDSRQTRTCFVHCNYDNFFAVQADHSLNISPETAAKFKERGIQLVFAHEHNARDLGNVKIIGNQIPSSIADCLDPNPAKQYATLDQNGKLETHDFIRVSDVYGEVDWRVDALPDKQFIRVVGEAEYEEAAAVVQKIAEWRRSSDAFVISNAVKVGTLSTEIGTADVQAEGFDVWQELLKHLPENLREFALEVKNHA